jgi:murein L,D-transpeptidase YafK
MLWPVASLAIPEDRVAAAYAECVPALKQRATVLKISWPPKKIYLRAIKDEKTLEVWAFKNAKEGFVPWAKHPIAAASGNLGPKRVIGDMQVPEGLYQIAVFNPKSRFHLSLGLNYPNKADRILGDKENPGSEIYIHGSRVSIGCLAMTDDIIKPIYVLANEVRRAGQKSIPVHIFPSRLTKVREARLCKSHPEHAVLWTELGPFFRYFEQNHQVPSHRISLAGTYILVKPTNSRR